MERIGIIAAMHIEMDLLIDNMDTVNTTRYMGLEFNVYS